MFGTDDTGNNMHDGDFEQRSCIAADQISAVADQTSDQIIYSTTERPSQACGLTEEPHSPRSLCLTTRPDDSSLRNPPLMHDDPLFAPQSFRSRTTTEAQDETQPGAFKQYHGDSGWQASQTQRKGALTPLAENLERPTLQTGRQEVYPLDEDSFSDDSVHDSIPKSKSQKKCYRLAFAFAIFILVLAGIACGMVFGLAINRPKSNSSEVTTWKELVGVCNGSENAGNFDVLSLLSVEAREKYMSLQNELALVAIEVPGLTQCSPQVLALASMAMSGRLNFDEANILQRFALTSFFFGANGIDWNSNQGWVDNPDICEWNGVGCERSGQEVVELSLTENTNLWGSLVDEIYQLISLKTLSLEGQNFDGTLSSMIGMLTNLESLTFWGSGLKTSIPTEVGRLTKLRTLCLHDYVKGLLPSEIGLLTNLEELRMTNLEESSIPAEIESLNKLRQLIISGDVAFLSGIWKLPYLIHLEFTPVAQLGGRHEIPAGAFENNTSWTHVQVTDGAVVGSIPTTIGYLRELEYLYLEKNLLEAVIPTEIGLCTKLRTLDLSRNVLAGTIPTELSNLSAIKRIILRDNHLTGILPSEIGNLPNLVGLDLGSNRFQVSVIPESYSRLTKLEFLRLDRQNHMFTATIPSGLCQIYSLTEFRVSCVSWPCSSSCCTCDAYG